MKKRKRNNLDIKYLIMASGEGKRWNNYLGIPKHLIEINGETLLGRTTRLLKENNIDYVITAHDERYKEYGKVIPQTHNDCEIDRFEEMTEPICYLYGDVYYSENAIRTIIDTPTNEILFFGSLEEIFAVKVVDLNTFYSHKNSIKKQYLKGVIDRCIGWEIYKSLNSIPNWEHQIKGRYILIEDETDDIDYPEDYEEFKGRLNEINNSKK